MATREENLKKINDELELMSDEELEQVAGGRIYLNSVQSVEKPDQIPAEPKKYGFHFV